MSVITFENGDKSSCCIRLHIKVKRMQWRSDFMT